MRTMFASKCCTAGAFILLSLFFCGQSLAAIAVIVHPSNESQFDKTTIERLFMGKMHSFENGRAALPLNATAGSETRELFNQQVIGRSEAQINAYWSRLLFTGKGRPPRELSSDSEILSAVAENKDAIGYIALASVTDAVRVVAEFE